MRCCRSTLLLVLSVLCSAAAWAQNNANFWMPGGPGGGPVGALAIDPDDADLIYAGMFLHDFDGYGVFKSENGGASWQAAGLRGHRVLHLTTAPDLSDLSAVYAVTTHLSGSEDNLFKSEDKGLSWSALAQTGLPLPAPGSSIAQFAAHPQAPATLYALFFDLGIYKSDDGGLSWRAANSGLPDFSLQQNPVNGLSGAALAFDPVAADTAYLALKQDCDLVLCTLAIYKSTDRGDVWQWQQTLADVPVFAGYALAAHSVDSGRLFLALDDRPAGEDSPARVGIQQSLDAGVSWDPLASIAIGDAHDDGIVRALKASAADSSALYLELGAGQSLWFSGDEGISWQSIDQGLPARIGLAAGFTVNPHPDAAEIVYAGTDGGVFRSDDNGLSWQSANQGINNSMDIVSVSADPGVSGTAYAATRTSGLFKTTDSGRSWRPVNNGLGDDLQISAFAIAPGDNRLLYAGTRTGLFRSLDSGLSWQASGGADKVLAPDEIAVHPHDGQTLYANGEEGIFKSTDGGASWTRADAGLPQFLPALWQHPLEIHPLLLTTLAIDRANPEILYAGFANAEYTHSATSIYRSVDGGASWQALDLQNLSVFEVLVHPADSDKLIAATGSGIYGSDDGGIFWDLLFQGAPTAAIEDIAFSPGDAGIVYATSGAEVYRSADGGAGWQRLEANEFFAITLSTLAVDAEYPDLVYRGTEHGVFVLSDERGLMNISTRGQAGAGEEALKAGFIIHGTAPVEVLVKGEGSSFGDVGIIDPLLQLSYLDGTPVAANDDWVTDSSADQVLLLAPPVEASEAALVRRLLPGAYIATLSSKTAARGLGLVSVTDVRAYGMAQSLLLSPSVALGPVNISTRGLVGHADNALKAGFIIQGVEAVTLLISGQGPGLGLPGALADPFVELTMLGGMAVKSNNNWADDETAALVAGSGMVLDDLEAAFVIELPPGAYIASLQGNDGGTGVGLIGVTDFRAFAR